jgi:glutathione reductase (NADPH)
MPEFDLVVIGGGNAGLTAAHEVARAGRKVALVDRGPVGGLCSLAGCNPKKVFVRATEVLQELRDAETHGIHIDGLQVDWERVWKRKRSFTDPVPAQTEKSLKEAGIQFVRGSARFVSANTIQADSTELRAEGFVIATGSHPRRLTFPGAEHLKISDDVLELRQPPKRMLMVGAGVVASEFGHVFARLGTQVTMVMRTKRALANYDDDFVAPWIRYSRDKLGIEFLTDAQVEAVEKIGEQLRVHIRTTEGAVTRDADFVLNAAGRVPSIESLALENAGVKVGPKGVLVDSYLRSTTNRRLFAGGDAHGKWQLSPIASYEGRLIARNFLEEDVQPADYSAIPHVVYTVPPLAAVGMTEAEAREAGREVVVKKSEMTGWKVYAIAGAQLAFAKVLLDNSSGHILGAQLLGDGAAEDIHLFALAIRAGIPAAELSEMVYAYPTFASAIPHLV